MSSGHQQFIEIPELEQGSSFWHDWRMGVIGSSDTPAIMGENPWKSRKVVLEEKSGARKVFRGNVKTQRGSMLEPEARKFYEKLLNFSVKPAVLQNVERPWQAASVDGINFKQQAVVEIKCGERAYEHTKTNRTVPGYYFGQLQHILSVTGLPWIDYFSYMPDREPLRLRVRRDESYIARMLKAQLCFKDELASRGFRLRETLFTSSSARRGSVLPAQAHHKGDLYLGKVESKVDRYPAKLRSRIQDRTQEEPMETVPASQKPPKISENTEFAFRSLPCPTCRIALPGRNQAR